MRIKIIIKATLLKEFCEQQASGTVNNTRPYSRNERATAKGLSHRPQAEA
jgi:hypothetical protein